MRKVIELALFTDKVAEMTAFYSALTGAPPNYANEMMATFALGELKLLIHARTPAAPGDPPNMDHFAFGVEDLAAETQAVGNRGLAFDIGPRNFDWGQSAYLRDPDGRLVELHQPRRYE
jgi:catechol 2,3-dioxygenase-like lactoylglutathione lyase family enzyme